jgi:hypothetical protein
LTVGSSPSCMSTLASTAGREIRSCSSSIIFATRSSRSRRAFRTGRGRTCSTRLPSARWFVQTVIDGAPPTEADSLARW